MKFSHEGGYCGWVDPRIAFPVPSSEAPIGLTYTARGWTSLDFGRRLELCLGMSPEVRLCRNIEAFLFMIFANSIFSWPEHELLAKYSPRNYFQRMFFLKLKMRTMNEPEMKRREFILKCPKKKNTPC